MNYIKENYKKFLATLVLVTLIFSVYLLFTPQADTISLDIAEANRAEVNRTVNMLRDVKKITIKKEIFSDELFTSLKETKVNLPQYELGKSNPFNPLATSTVENINELFGLPAAEGDNQDPSEIIEFNI